jgi:hypothetical protein
MSNPLNQEEITRIRKALIFIRDEYGMDAAGIHKEPLPTHVGTSIDVIRSPGKFEAEHISTVYFYQQMMEGCSDESFDGTDLFVLTPEEQFVFDELDPVNKYTHFRMICREDGFVLGAFLTTVEYGKAFSDLFDAMEASCEQPDGEEGVVSEDAQREDM